MTTPRLTLTLALTLVSDRIREQARVVNELVSSAARGVDRLANHAGEGARYNL